MSIFSVHAALVPDLMGLAFAVYCYVDRFRGINTMWDDIERLMPDWMTYRRWGNPITWVHHAVTTLVFAWLGGCLVWLNGGAFLLGQAHWALGAAVAYALREAMNWDRHAQAGTEDAWSIRKGWKVDGIMDTIGPVLVAAIAVWAL